MTLRNAFEDLATEATLQGVLDALGGAGGRLDSDNSTFTALGPTAPGGTTFTGAWTESKGQAAISFFAFSDQPLTTARLEWSDDGVSPATGLLATADYLTSEELITGFYVYYPDPQTYLLRDYYRVVLENTGTDQALLEAYMWEFPTGSSPFAFLDADGVPSTLQKALLTKPVNAALLISDFSDAENGTIPSGALPTIDPVLNTEPNVLDSGWIDTRTFAGKNVVGVLGDTALKVFLMNASDDQGDNIFGDGAPTLVTQAGFPAQLSALYADKYYRILVVNDSGSDLTSYRVQSRAAPESTEGVTTAIEQPVFGFFPANVQRSVVMGRQPDGDYVNVPATGLARDISGADVETATPLGASQTWSSDWCDTDGFDEIEIVVLADQVSASEGVLIEFTEDVGATTPVTRVQRATTYGADDVAQGGLAIRVPPRLDGFRVSYTNGGTAQGTFFLSCTLRADATALPRTEVGAQLNQSAESIITKSVISVRDTGTGTFKNVAGTEVAGQQALDTYIVGSAEVPLKALNSWDSKQITVNTTPQEITGSTPLAGRRSLTMIADQSNNRDIYFGPTSGVSTAKGFLAPGEGIDLELDDQAEVWVVTSAGTATLKAVEIGTTS